MKKELEELQKKASAELTSAKNREEIQAIKNKYIGRKGLLTQILRTLKDVPSEERPALGQLSNVIKASLSAQVEDALRNIALVMKDEALLEETIDISLPGRSVKYGKVHPITRVSQEICEILMNLGFAVVEGPEVEFDYYNFEALNIPKDHPARDMQDTFYIEDDIVLRTHTSPVQVRIMEKQKPPVRIISPGKVYRPDSDVSHTPMFHQIEGLLVDKGITFGDLKGVLTYFLHQVFDKDMDIRFRPSFFPFTEPSAEVDI
ncbi:MAG: phenylalanine--tRNA ligase subunit alpha, partial [Deltaproteobacteria bacterium]|nr:phenylalanine--tRNA ligase subunit alpha [Deltaproteobacteria bacterium]